MKREEDAWDGLTRAIIVVCLILVLGLVLALVGTVYSKPEAPVFTEFYEIDSYNVAGEDRFIYVISFEFETIQGAFDFVTKVETNRGEK